MKMHVIMPMGGRGSRFFKNGFVIPKPLIEIHGKPFLYWATKSLTDFVEMVDLRFVVLQEHIDEFKIDKTILKYFPEAKIVVIKEVLNGAVLTCLEGIKDIEDDYPVIFNDCDHMFRSTAFEKADLTGVEGALLTFTSNEPKYSFAQLDEKGNVIKTVEKVVVSDQAICGAYYVKDAATFKKMSESYLTNCSYNEFYVSGVYNEMIKANMTIKTYLTDFHVPFGTPDEYFEAEKSEFFEVFE